MSKTHGSRKQDIEMAIMIKIYNKDFKGAIALCERYNVSPKRFGELINRVDFVCGQEAVGNEQ